MPVKADQAQPVESPLFKQVPSADKASTSMPRVGRTATGAGEAGEVGPTWRPPNETEYLYTYTWGYNLTCNCGNPHEPISGYHKQGHKPVM